ncbi:MAG TPA: hypothetical protein VFJ70_13620 [Burkholderiales bacterium]|nr:hypothetical protein [Burkholderiales bacterium]
MSKLPLILSLSGIAALAGCATEHKVAPAPAPVVVQPAATVAAPPTAVVVPQAGTGAVLVTPVATGPLRAGYGRIDSVIDLAPSAAAGSSVPGATKRVGVRMDDGALQYLDTAANDLAVGDRVSITSDGYMRHPAP